MTGREPTGEATKPEIAGREVVASSSSGMHLIQYWHAETVPSPIGEAIATFRDHNPTLRHALFNERSAEALIEEHFTSREVTAFRTCAVPAMQADYFRYCAIVALGGVYADADMRCIASLAPLITPVTSVQFFYRSAHHIVPNGFFIAKYPRHPLLRFALRVATINIEQRSLQSVWCVTGPAIISVLYGLHQFGAVEAYLAPGRFPKHREQMRQLAEVIQTEARGSGEELLADVQFLPLEMLRAFAVDEPMPYKREAQHWLNWQGSIYRLPEDMQTDDART